MKENIKINSTRKTSKIIISLLLVAVIILSGCGQIINNNSTNNQNKVEENQKTKQGTENVRATDENDLLEKVPEFSEEPYVIINENKPSFSEKELTTTSYERYGNLDNLGRCEGAIANIGTDIMPTEKRGSIGMIRPSGWHLKKYNFVDGKYLYNRCHLIGYQLTGENANEKNLITGTRYMNVDGMLPFENIIANYVKETKNHVVYRVKPLFRGNNKVASGVHMEAKSVEDSGQGVSFNVYIYNNQPGVKIDYLTGESYVVKGKKSQQSEEKTKNKELNYAYVINMNSMKFHKTTCKSVDTIKEKIVATIMALAKI